MKKIWPFSFYLLYFAAFASLLPFFVLFYQQLGFNGAQIGLLTGIPPLITLAAAPFLTGVADSTQRHRLIMSLGMVGAITVVLIMPYLKSFALIFSLVVTFNIFMSPLSPLADSATLSMLGEERATYGQIRLGGTIGWGFFAPIAGALVENHGLRIGFWLFAAIMLINLLVSQKFRFGKEEGQGTKNGGIRILLTNRRWIFFLLTAFLGGLGAMSAASYLFPYMADIGADETSMGIALTISTLSEMPVFLFGHRLVRRFTPRGLLILALVLMSIRCLLYAAVDTPALVFVVQAFGGTIFPILWLAGVSYADENAPAGLKSTAQGLFGAMTFGFGSAVGGFLGGLMLESIGGRGMFLVFGIMILVGLALIEGVKRLLPQEEIPQPMPE
ncbi:MAG TPA: major facilitator superfamily domain-containing protein 6 [Anaerolineales bacterium]|nr:major facilitator superfamily domain-containing protein 6 [Anaerolineales bacterium]